MTEDEIRDILTCARECPESPFNVDRIEQLVEECLRLKAELDDYIDEY